MKILVVDNVGGLVVDSSVEDNRFLEQELQFEADNNKDKQDKRDNANALDNIDHNDVDHNDAVDYQNNDVEQKQNSLRQQKQLQQTINFS